MSNSFQIEAVARLTKHCEKLASSGCLPFEDELTLRVLTNLTCNAFDMATVAERPPVAERPSKELVEQGDSQC